MNGLIFYPGVASLPLYYGENQSYEALSRLLKLPEGTVKSRLSRARENLRKVLGQGDATF